MRLSKETEALFTEVLGKKPTENRIRAYLQGERPLPVPMGGQHTTPTMGGQHIQPTAEVSGVSLNVEQARAVLRKFTGTGSRSGFATLEEAALTLLSVLEPSHQDIVRNTATEVKWPGWVLFCGAVARACDHRELHAGDYHADWLNQPGKVSPADIK